MTRGAVSGCQSSRTLGGDGIGRFYEEDRMARSLLVAPAAEGVGLARTCLGLLRALDRRGVKVAFVKPVAQPRADIIYTIALTAIQAHAESLRR
jgi:AAA domain